MGKVGYHFSEESKEKMRKSRLHYYETHTTWNKGKHPSPETKLKMRLAKLGKHSNRKGCHQSLTSIEKNRQAHLGKKMSATCKEKHSIASKRWWENGGLSDASKELIRKKLLGHPVSEETMAKMISGQKANPYKHTEEFKEALSKRVKGNTFAKVTTEEQAKRRAIIRAKIVIPFYDTKPEKKVQSLLDQMGIKYRKHIAFYLGNRYMHYADIVVDTSKTILEIDGCYWHQCAECGYESGAKGKTAKELRATDRMIDEKLTGLGYKVFRIWEHDINKRDVITQKLSQIFASNKVLTIDAN